MLLAVSIGLGIVGVALAIDGFSNRSFRDLVMGNWNAPKAGPGPSGAVGNPTGPTPGAGVIA